MTQEQFFARYKYNVDTDLLVVGDSERCIKPLMRRGSYTTMHNDSIRKQ